MRRRERAVRWWNSRCRPADGVRAKRRKLRSPFARPCSYKHKLQKPPEEREGRGRPIVSCSFHYRLPARLEMRSFLRRRSDAAGLNSYCAFRENPRSSFWNPKRQAGSSVFLDVYTNGIPGWWLCAWVFGKAIHRLKWVEPGKTHQNPPQPTSNSPKLTTNHQRFTSFLADVVGFERWTHFRWVFAGRI